MLELAKKVKAGPSPEHTLLRSFELFQAGDFPEKTVTVTLKNGTVLKKTGKTHKGHPADMFNWSEICDLFRTEVAEILTPEQTERFIDFVAHVESISDMSVLSELLGG